LRKVRATIFDPMSSESIAGESIYHDGMRRLQDARETRRIADRLEAVIVHSTFTTDDREFIERCPMVFVATADANGRPDCSYKGGLPGFVRVIDDHTLVIPDYDGNGMYRTWGNVDVNPHIGLLFVNFTEPDRIRVNGTATIVANDPWLAQFPGAVFLVRIAATMIFPNCSRYIHRMNLVEHSIYAPGTGHTPPIPGWKKDERFRDALPSRDRRDV
jgi:uncharacterized protein